MAMTIEMSGRSIPNLMISLDFEPLGFHEQKGHYPGKGSQTSQEEEDGGEVGGSSGDESDALDDEGGETRFDGAHQRRYRGDLMTVHVLFESMLVSENRPDAADVEAEQADAGVDRTDPTARAPPAASG
jgi:hypothetical protein